MKIRPERPCVQEAAKPEQQDKEGSGVLKRDVEKGCSQFCTSGLPSASAQRTSAVPVSAGRSGAS